jgi:SAM-dependent methyltransferase
MLLDEITGYYAEKLNLYGDTPQGVDWNGKESQELRFQQLLKVIPCNHSFSVNDFGCGFGSLYSFMETKYKDFDYFGNDVSEEMIKMANERNKKSSNAHFLKSEKPVKIADYCIASGIFNVKLNNDIQTWEQYILKNLKLLNQRSKRGFSFNCLTSYSEIDKMKEHLYYGNPCSLFDICKRNFSKNVSLLHDYDLYEFSIIVRK